MEAKMTAIKGAKVLFLIVILSGLLPCSAWADENAKALVGTWKLTG